MWKDIAGHENLIDRLRGYSLSGNLPHAFLFSGPEGVGKTAVAREFFKAVNCLKSTGSPCDSCRSCLKANSGSHPDLVTVGPSGGKAVIVIEDIRNVISEVGLKPFEARTRFVVVEPAEKMNIASANALLKTLEEPPGSTVVILVSHNPPLLLPTVVSRCQVLRFSPLDAATLSAGPMDPAVLRLTTGTTGGLKGLDEELVRKIRSEMLQSLREGDPIHLVNKYFPNQEKGGELLPVVVLLAESLIRDLLVLSLGGGDIINGELRGFPLRGAGYLELEEAAACLRSIRKGANENIRLPNALSELFMRIQQLLDA